MHENHFIGDGLKNSEVRFICDGKLWAYTWTKIQYNKRFTMLYILGIDPLFNSIITRNSTQKRNNMPRPEVSWTSAGICHLNREVYD